MSKNLGFLQESDGSFSMSRLCMLLATIGGVIIGYRMVGYFKDISIWMVAVTPFSIMLGGCLPYIFNKINETKNQILNNPELIKELKRIVNKDV